MITSGSGAGVASRSGGYSRDELAILVREYLLAGHMIDRAGMPHVIGEFGRQAMQEVAIDEWMGASPIYTRRSQRLMDFVGDDVETMFKGIQFDVGSPPQFMDFRFKIYDADHGEFWLNSCGALLDVEPMGDEFIVTMCHHIEDPTFDATAAAVNPRARVRPIHRPPRVPTDRHPHCHWTVVIDPEADALEEPAPAERLGASLAATLPLSAIETDEADDGRRDYRGPLEADVRLEGFSRGLLVAISDEVCLQGHLLAMAFMAAIEHRFGLEAATTIGRKQLIGVAGLTADRLRRAFGLESDMASIAAVLEVHPAFRPRSYVDFRVDHDLTTDRLTVQLHPCAALEEPREHPWPALMTADDPAPLEAILHAINPAARCVAIEPEARAAWAWEVVLGHEPTKEAPEVLLTRFSTGADFVFQPR